MALMAAIDGFDPDKNVKFETYAGIRIKGAVIDYMRKLDRVPRTPPQAVKATGRQLCKA